jgi:hypothetical protein
MTLLMWFNLCHVGIDSLNPCIIELPTGLSSRVNILAGRECSVWSAGSCIKCITPQIGKFSVQSTKRYQIRLTVLYFSVFHDSSLFVIIFNGITLLEKH